MLGFYLDLPAWVRAVIALGVLGIGIGLCFHGYVGRPTFTESKLPNGDVVRQMKGEGAFAHLELGCGLVVSMIGAGLLTACGKSDSEKHGYNF